MYLPILIFIILCVLASIGLSWCIAAIFLKRKGFKSGDSLKIIYSKKGSMTEGKDYTFDANTGTIELL